MIHIIPSSISSFLFMSLMMLTPYATAVEKDSFTVVCFGDSITGHRPNTVYQGNYVKYSDMLGLMIEAKLGPDSVNMVNSGWAGDRTVPKPSEGWPGARARVGKDIVAHKPAIVTMLIGGNNRANTPEKINQLTEDLRAMVKEVETAGIKLLLLQYPPALPHEKHADQGWPLATYANPIIAQVAKETNTPILDLGPAMLAAVEKVGRDQLVNDKDGVHLKAGGELVFAKAIFHELVRLEWLVTE